VVVAAGNLRYIHLLKRHRQLCVFYNFSVGDRLFFFQIESKSSCVWLVESTFSFADVDSHRASPLEDPASRSKSNVMKCPTLHIHEVRLLQDVFLDNSELFDSVQIFVLLVLVAEIVVEAAPTDVQLTP